MTFKTILVMIVGAIAASLFAFMVYKMTLEKSVLVTVAVIVIAFYGFLFYMTWRERTK